MRESGAVHQIERLGHDHFDHARALHLASEAPNEDNKIPYTIHS